MSIGASLPISGRGGDENRIGLGRKSGGRYACFRPGEFQQQYAELVRASIDRVPSAPHIVQSVWDRKLRLLAGQTMNRNRSEREIRRFENFWQGANRSTIHQNSVWRLDFRQKKARTLSEPFNLVERRRIELPTSALRTQRSPS